MIVENASEVSFDRGRPQDRPIPPKQLDSTLATKPLPKEYLLHRDRSRNPRKVQMEMPPFLLAQARVARCQVEHGTSLGGSHIPGRLMSR
jgi:hypothetical protein